MTIDINGINYIICYYSIIIYQAVDSASSSICISIIFSGKQITIL